MQEQRYNIVFTGQIQSNNDIETVKRNLMIGFHINENLIEKLFSGRRIIVRKNVDYQKALLIKQKIEKAGALCEIKPIQLSETKDESQSRKVKRCPKCGYLVKTVNLSSNYRCPECGAVYANMLKKTREKTRQSDVHFERSHNADTETDHRASKTASRFAAGGDTKTRILSAIKPYLPTEAREFFSMKGRVNRAKFLCTQILLNAVSWLVAVILPNRGSAEMLLGPVGFIILMILIVMMAFNIVKRFHDLDRSGYYFWLAMFVPFFNIYLIVLLLFVKGTEGQNQYGPDPLQTLTEDYNDHTL